MTTNWDIRGWKHLTVHEDPPLVAAREEFLAWLSEVPEPHNIDLGRRLKSQLNHPHFSARLELFSHHHFVSDEWNVTIHPDLPDTPNHPDFLMKRQEDHFLLECKSVFDQTKVAQQDQRLRQLAEQVSRKLGVTILLHPLEDLPQNLPATRIRREIENRVQEIGEVQEIDILGEHRGERFGLRAVALPEAPSGEPTGGVEGLMSPVQTIKNSQRLRDQLQEKAGKYGELQSPFMIAVSAETKFPTTTKHEVEALFGDIVWQMPPVGDVIEDRNYNGLFTMTLNGKPRYNQVSAVLVYRFKWLEDAHEHRLHIHHNPYAIRPLDPELFPGVPQLVCINETRMGWINGEPKAS